MSKQGQQVLKQVVSDLGGTPRAGQEEMVRLVEDAIENQKHLLVQAGTGTGKSFGYLVPLMLSTVNTGERAVVSTSTLALQRQIVKKDAPAVAKALKKVTGQSPRVALLKGWNNYVCRHKLSGGYASADTLFDSVEAMEPPGGAGAPSALGKAVQRVRAWAEETDTGDRDDLVPGVTDRAWRQVSLSKKECLTENCPFWDECFPRMAREEAAEADLVVTNHALLGIEAAGGSKILPDYQTLVVDEAHDLASSVRNAVSVNLTGPQIAATARLLGRATTTGVEELAATGRALENALLEIPEGWIRGQGPENLEAAIDVLAGQAKEIARELSSKGSGEVTPQIVLARAAATDLATALASLQCRDESIVRWVTRNQDGLVSLHAAPLHVASEMAHGLFAEHPVVLTSATLCPGGSFDSVAQSTGMNFCEEPWEGKDLGSPFDYQKQGILYVAKDLPAPTQQGPSEQLLLEMKQLVEASQGGMLALFSSRRAAEVATEYLREHTDFRIFSQGEDSLGTLVKEFAEDGHACLVGTLSLWQGVDVPGLACRLVLIDKLPFPRPNDPLIQARNQAVERAGGSSFRVVSLTHASLLLAQGAGRLLRSVNDRGVVAILDSRLAKASYARFVIDSLPPFWRTTDGKVVRSALTRLGEQAKEV
ncbi:hypothetical protein BSR28_03235 [Boudabousia liubingyangii]|uniref:ATP-dependent DNA helicase n=1 Tax=Boudabousia liubingyangii TaxID=1921764 RepID=UPI0009401E2E|nr:ATP-dependent DNA helicase [Boudabousia liubingyangii]OKL47525.1 hypothetical protein BSR28_03235 [Boudabousia liubingyangii]